MQMSQLIVIASQFSMYFITEMMTIPYFSYEKVKLALNRTSLGRGQDANKTRNPIFVNPHSFRNLSAYS